jgi:hypothetical protein
MGARTVDQVTIVRGDAPNGYGSGYGDGGYGDGSGSGSGYGYGSGYGDGYGDGSGGYGDGSGSGYGYGSVEYWAACVDYLARAWPDGLRARLTDLRKARATIAFWRSDANGRACNGGSNAPVKPGTVETSPGPLSLCAAGTLHATLLPPRWHGERWWIVALIGEVVGDGEKFGALKREIIGEV